MQYLSFSMVVVLVGIILKIGSSILRKIVGYTRFGKMITPQPHPIMIYLHREVEELKRTTLQITKDWAEMNHLIQCVREQQNHFVVDLETDLNSMRDSLGESLATRLHEERVQAELRSEVIGRTVGAMAREMAEMRQEMGRKVLAVKSMAVEEFTQTEGVRKRQRDAKGTVLSDQETIKTVMSTIKQALVEFLKEAKKNLSRERSEMMDNVRVIFTQLGDDRDDIKASIAGAFGVSSQQTLRCFEQLGVFGRDAVGCIVTNGDRADRATANRFQELSSKLRDVLRSLKVVDVNASSVKEALEKIDRHFTDINHKLDVVKQSGSESCSDVAERMAAATRDFEDKTYELDLKHRQLGEIIAKVKDTLDRFGNHAVDTVELQTMVDVCGTRVQVVTAVLEQFASRVEKPMQQVVCQMKFLTNVVGRRLEDGTGQQLLLSNIQSGEFDVETDQRSQGTFENESDVTLLTC